MSFAESLAKFTVASLTGAPREVVWATTTDKCPSILTTLAERQIQSLPVWDEESGSFVGFVDVIDMLTLLVVMNNAKKFADLLATRPVSWEEFIALEIDMFSNQSIKDVCNVSKRNPWCPVHMEVPLHSLMDMFGKDVNLHRVAVVNDAGDVVGIVTQSQVIRFLADSVHNYESIAQAPIASWYSPSGTVISVPNTGSALESFQSLLENNVSAVAVVDGDGKIVGALSASDIKSVLGKEIFADLNLPLAEFQAKSNQFFKRPANPICCKTTDSISTILALLNDNHIHRIFVVDNNDRPIGVLSLCDVISYLNQALSA